MNPFNWTLQKRCNNSISNVYSFYKYHAIMSVIVLSYLDNLRLKIHACTYMYIHKQWKYWHHQMAASELTWCFKDLLFTCINVQTVVFTSDWNNIILNSRNIIRHHFVPFFKIITRKFIIILFRQNLEFDNSDLL